MMKYQLSLQHERSRQASKLETFSSLIDNATPTLEQELKLTDADMVNLHILIYLSLVDSNSQNNSTY